MYKYFDKNEEVNHYNSVVKKKKNSFFLGKKGERSDSFIKIILVKES